MTRQDKIEEIISRLREDDGEEFDEDASRTAWASVPEEEFEYCVGFFWSLRA